MKLDHCCTRPHPITEHCLPTECMTIHRAKWKVKRWYGCWRLFCQWKNPKNSSTSLTNNGRLWHFSACHLDVFPNNNNNKNQMENPLLLMNSTQKYQLGLGTIVSKLTLRDIINKKILFWCHASLSNVNAARVYSWWYFCIPSKGPQICVYTKVLVWRYNMCWQ